MTTQNEVGLFWSDSVPQEIGSALNPFIPLIKFYVLQLQNTIETRLHVIQMLLEILQILSVQNSTYKFACISVKNGALIVSSKYRG